MNSWSWWLFPHESRPRMSPPRDSQCFLTRPNLLAVRGRHRVVTLAGTKVLFRTLRKLSSNRVYVYRNRFDISLYQSWENSPFTCRLQISADDSISLSYPSLIWWGLNISWSLVALVAYYSHRGYYDNPKAASQIVPRVSGDACVHGRGRSLSSKDHIVWMRVLSHWWTNLFGRGAFKQISCSKFCMIHPK